MVSLCGVAWFLLPELLTRMWPYLAVYAAFLVFVELRWRQLPEEAAHGHRAFVGCVLAGGVLLLTVSGGTQLAIATGFLDAEWLPAVRRIKGFMTGLLLMLAGNFLPKLASPWKLSEELFDWQGVHRFGGWLLLVAGAITCYAWAILQPAAADRLAVVTQITAFVVLVCRKYFSLLTWNGHPR